MERFLSHLDLPTAHEPVRVPRLRGLGHLGTDEAMPSIRRFMENEDIRPGIFWRFL
jgi:hypothetical protein